MQGALHEGAVSRNGSEQTSFKDSGMQESPTGAQAMRSAFTWEGGSLGWGPDSAWPAGRCKWQRGALGTTGQLSGALGADR
eukprot:6282477-Alexandrium_andersonii.AAC.1